MTLRKISLKQFTPVAVGMLMTLKRGGEMLILIIVLVLILGGGGGYYGHGRWGAGGGMGVGLGTILVILLTAYFLGMLHF